MSVTIQSVPASYYVNTVPSVIGAGATGVLLADLMLTTNTRVQIGAVLGFPTAAAVGQFFGYTSNEYNSALVYFAGYSTALTLPSILYFAQYPTASVGAYLRGGNVASLTLAQLQAISGVLTVTIDGTPHTSSAINLSSATSFSSAAELITDGLALTGPTQATITGAMGATFTGTAGTPSTHLIVTSVTGLISIGDTVTGTGIPASTTVLSQISGTTGGAGTYNLSAANTASSASCQGSSNVLVVSAVATGALAIGQEVTGGAVSAGTFITALGTGTTGTGTYVTTTQNYSASGSLTMVLPTVTWDSVSGAFIVVSSTTGTSSTMSYGSGTIAAPLALTAATGAVTSQGAIAAVPASFMAAVVAQNINFAVFQTLFDPDGGSGNTQKQAFAAWVNSTNNQYMYACWDTDITPTESTNAPTCLGQILKANGSSGTALIYEPAGSNLHLAAFLAGYAASIDFNATNGRATADYKSQSGISPSVTSVTAKANLIANGYNSYDGVATRGASWQFFDNGQITGTFSWIDTYLNQIWLNNQCQIALMTLLTTVGFIPYNPRGYGMIRTTLTAGATGSFVPLPPASPVAAGLNNGVINPNVPLSGEQQVAVNAAAGSVSAGSSTLAGNIASTLTSQGWYLSIQPATASVRQARGSPTIILLYLDGGSVQRINLSSIVVL